MSLHTNLRLAFRSSPNQMAAQCRPEEGLAKQAVDRRYGGSRCGHLGTSPEPSQAKHCLYSVEFEIGLLEQEIQLGATAPRGPCGQSRSQAPRHTPQIAIHCRRFVGDSSQPPSRCESQQKLILQELTATF
jgi:hypothetical protein